jgi:hypothetical protein
VIKQKGAWFLVRAATHQGWLHGNTIKLAESREDNESSPSDNLNPQPGYSSSYTSNSYSTSTGGYYTGPRGGCYTYSSSGKKKIC